MPTFNNINELRKYVQGQIDKSLMTDVSEVIKDTMVESIQKTVYDVQSKSVDRRRGSNGGLLDRNNIRAGLQSSGELRVWNETQVNPLRHNEMPGYDVGDNSFFNNAFPRSYGLAEIIEYGNTKGIIQNESRPFMENTNDMLEKSGKHINALKKGLTKANIEVE